MESSLASTNILLIDDDRDSLTTFETLLSNKGYSVETAETGTQALEKSRKKKFDLALIDITLPDMEGTKLLNTLSSCSEMRRIIITGKATFDNAVDALNLGADAYLMKPVNPENLLKVIEEQLQEKLDQSLVTQERLSQYIQDRRDDFVSIVKDSLNSLLGESTAKTTIFYLGGEESLKDPKKLEANLRSLFDVGAERVLDEILKNMERLRSSEERK